MIKRTSLAFALVAALGAGGLAIAQVQDAAGVRAALQQAGHNEIRDIEQDDGLWEAKVRGADGRWYDVHVDPGTGQVLDARAGTALMSADQVRTAVESQGYTQVRDLDLDDAIWELDANDGDGRKVELKVSALDGRVLVVDYD
ncbi:MAG: PepSY domain-containing protein [Xanthomonadales bacterium]|nr:PepSY domain-containing protein [Xanthomonadales bacterium]